MIIHRIHALPAIRMIMTTRQILITMMRCYRRIAWKCHTEVSWLPSSFDHEGIYPLNGAHDLISNDCLACHSGGYDNTPNTCIACHQDDYDNATNPDHNDAMLSTDCLECHTEVSWLPSSFDHEGIYPLNGAHDLISNDCLACHSGGYDNTPNTCIACHQDDYDNRDKSMITMMRCYRRIAWNAIRK